jgi:hypothetical protein
VFSFGSEPTAGVPDLAPGSTRGEVSLAPLSLSMFVGALLAPGDGDPRRRIRQRCGRPDIVRLKIKLRATTT